MKNMNKKLSPVEKRKEFVSNEQQFHLGFLPTEQSNPKTRALSQTIARDTQAGISMLLSVDADIVPVASDIFAGGEFGYLVDSIVASIEKGGHIFFSGCGSTGRLSILLDAAWRRFWQDLATTHADLASRFDCVDLENRTISIMTGGDRALIKSVENFEDFMQFGRRQMIEKNVGPDDTLIAITEGGETSSVIGTAWEAVESGAVVFLAFNNPAEILAQHVERSERIINHPGVTVLDLSSGPMAIAGSTRMQATTSELLVIGAAMENALGRILSDKLSDAELNILGFDNRKTNDYADVFDDILRQLNQPEQTRVLAELTEYEQGLYEADGRITYLAEDYLLDILTDTTERAPTFMLPPFRKCNDEVSAPSWSFVKNPLYATREVWQRTLRRPPDGLEWTRETYRDMDIPDSIADNPPLLDNNDIYRFLIGNEDDYSRYDAPASTAACVLVGEEAVRCRSKGSPFMKSAKKLAGSFHEFAVICIGSAWEGDADERVFNVKCELPSSLIHLWEHLAVKLVLNTVSTATMARMGRVRDNWMIYAEATNKKLIDRGTRLVQYFTGVNYDQACEALFETLDDISAQPPDGRIPAPPTVLTIERIEQTHNIDNPDLTSNYAALI